MLTAEEYNKHYEVLKTLSLDLDVDPITKGLDSLTKKLSEVQELRNRVSKAMLIAIQNKTEAEIEYKRVDNILETRKTTLVLQDDFVRGQKSQEMRDLAAQSKMPELVLEQHQKEVDLVRADAYLKFVQQISDNLEAANTNLSRQISVIQMSVSLG